MENNNVFTNLSNTSSTKNNSKTKSTDLIKKVQSNLSVVIANKKLSFNQLWISKFNEDPYLIQPLDNTNENYILINILFNSILEFSKKINDLLVLLINQDLSLNKQEEYVHKISLYSRSLMMKIKNFQEVKNKTFKLTKESLFEIKHLNNNFNMINIADGAKSVANITKCLEDFYLDLTKHLSN